MGYAGQLEDDPDLSGETRRKASVIRQQSTKIKNLIHDLNLASKLEYNMQPLHPQPVNLIAVARQCAADFLNADLEGKYPLQWRAPEHIPACILQGDPNLLHRALENLLHNAQSHNPDGCRITLEVSVKAGACCIAVSDDGVGMTGKQLEKLQNTPHYMMNDAGIAEPRHGLGLLIVQQIVPGPIMELPAFPPCTPMDFASQSKSPFPREKQRARRRAPIKQHGSGISGFGCAVSARENSLFPRAWNCGRMEPAGMMYAGNFRMPPANARCAGERNVPLVRRTRREDGGIHGGTPEKSPPTEGK